MCGDTRKGKEAKGTPALPVSRLFLKPFLKRTHTQKHHGSPSLTSTGGDFPAMTSIKVIAPINVHHAALLSHLNLPTHMPGTSLLTNKTGRPNLMITTGVQSHTRIIQIGRTGTPGGKWGDQSPLDTHPSWQDHNSYDPHSSWHDQQRDPPKPAARLSAAPQFSRSKPITAFSQSHTGKHKKPAKSSWQQSRSDQSYHSWAATPHTEGSYQGISQGRHPARLGQQSQMGHEF